MTFWILALIHLCAPADAATDRFQEIAEAIDDAAAGDAGLAADVALAARESHFAGRRGDRPLRRELRPLPVPLVEHGCLSRGTEGDRREDGRAALRSALCRRSCRGDGRRESPRVRSAGRRRNAWGGTRAEETARPATEDARRRDGAGGCMPGRALPSTRRRALDVVATSREGREQVVPGDRAECRRLRRM